MTHGDGGSMPPPDDDGARAAADRAAENEGLLDGENLHTTRLDEVEHWISVYSELTTFKEALLNVSDQQIRTMTKVEAKEESQDVDVVLLSHQLDKYRRRLDFWVRRRDDLRAA